MTVRYFRSTDTSAPTLNGTAGSLITLLDACLVNGYGSQSAAGWTKAFSGTNQAAYRNSTSTGTGFYLNIDDRANSGQGGREVYATGFQTMSAIATGTGMFPGSNLITFGVSPTSAVAWRKSATADSTARPWVLIADETVFYLFVETGDAYSPAGTYACMFGDIISYAPSDPYRCMIIGNPVNGADWQRMPFAGVCNNPSNSLVGHCMAADWYGGNVSPAVGKLIDSVKMGYGGWGGSTGFNNWLYVGNTITIGNLDTSPNAFPFPNAVDGNMLMSPVWICHNYKIRGYLKGIWAPLHHVPLQHGESFSGTGTLAGKTFQAQWTYSPGTNSSWGASRGCVMIETSNTWS